MRWEYVSFVFGISLCLIGAFLIFEGSILGEDTAGWATVIGIVGIGLIGTSGAGFSARAAKTRNRRRNLNKP